MLSFKLPMPSGASEPPKWSGRNFTFDGQHSTVLEYSENFEGWSDDLTSLHEETVGDRHPIDFASRAAAMRQVAKFIPSSKATILEIGCSSGFLLRDLVGAFPEAEIIGVDVVKEPLFRLSKILPGIPLIRFDLLQCPLPDCCVDVVIMLNVLEHINDDVAALQNVFKLLRPGGALIIEVPAGPMLYDSYDAELLHFRRYSSSDLMRKLVLAGFEVKRKTHLGFILFPAFAIVKLINKYFPNKKNTAIVHSNAAKTSNPVIGWLMKFETKCLSAFSLKFGIRVFAVAVKEVM